MNNDIRMDANESAFFARELEVVKAKTYDKRYPELKAVQLIPVEVDAGGVGAETITWKSFDSVGVAKIVADYAKDFPRIDIFGRENSAKVRTVGASYGYSLKEIRKARLAGLPLEARKAAAARLAIETKIDSIAWKGDAKNNLQGLANYPGAQSYVVSGATASAKKWANKTPDQILADIKGAITQVQTVTEGVENPDTLILPLDAYNILAYTKVSDKAEKTILTFIRENYPQLRKIDWVNDLRDAGEGGVSRGLLYKADADHLALQLLLPFEQHSPQQEGLEFKVVCDAEIGGVIAYYPLSIITFDGI